MYFKFATGCDTYEYEGKTHASSPNMTFFNKSKLGLKYVVKLYKVNYM